MFASYADEDDEYIASMEGIAKLGEGEKSLIVIFLMINLFLVVNALITFVILDIEIDALEDVRILVLLWKLGAKDKPAQINRDEVCCNLLK